MFWCNLTLYRILGSFSIPFRYLHKIFNTIEIRNYKQLVGTISGYKDLNRYDYVIFYSIAVHHLKKANYILSNDDSIPSYQEYLAFDLIKLYDAQVDLFRTESRSFVLNTCIFVLSDYSPKRFFNFVSTHKKDLLI